MAAIENIIWGRVWVTQRRPREEPSPLHCSPPRPLPPSVAQLLISPCSASGFSRFGKGTTV